MCALNGRVASAFQVKEGIPVIQMVSFLALTFRSGFLSMLLISLARFAPNACHSDGMAEAVAGGWLAFFPGLVIFGDTDVLSGAFRRDTARP